MTINKSSSFPSNRPSQSSYANSSTHTNLTSLHTMVGRALSGKAKEMMGDEDEEDGDEEDEDEKDDYNEFEPCRS